MPATPSDNETFLRNGDVVTVGIDLPGKTFAEDLATVIVDESNEILLQLCGSGFPPHLPITCGANVIITRGECKTIFHCTTRLKEPVSNSLLKIEIPEKVMVSERHEYMRADVRIPVNYYLPATQNMGRVIAQWESLRGCSDECTAETAAGIQCVDSRVNLSGSGLRFKIHDCLSYGTLLHLKIALPGAAPDHIHAVGSIIRTKELLPKMVHIEYYSTSMAFRIIESNDRLKLMKYIIEEQHKNYVTPPQPFL